jgi:acetyltransferase-like isoleucine patch superfamily enzyme
MNLIAGHGGVSIGNDVIIGSHCSISASEHHFSSAIAIRYQGERALGIEISDGVWIGAGCRILDGVKIGEGAIVGAGSVVRHSISPGEIVAGVPARSIKERTNE